MGKVMSVIGTILSTVLVILICALMIVSAVTLSLGATVLNRDFVMRELREKEVYKALCDEVKATALQAYRNSGIQREELDPIIDGVLDAAVRPDPVRKETEELLGQLYEGQDLQVNGSYLNDDYSNTIHSYLDERGVAVEQETVRGLVNTVADAVRRNVDLSEYMKQISALFRLAGGAIIWICLGSFVLSALLLLLFLFRRRKLKWISMPFIIAGAILLLAALFCWLFLPKDITFLNLPITALVYSFIRRALLILGGIGLVRLAVGVLLAILGRKKHKPATAD